MLPRTVYPAGVPCWIDVEVPDTDAAARFYEQLFGWQFEDVTPAGSAARALVARLDGQAVGGVRSLAEASATAAWSTSVAVDDADRAAQRWRDAGGTVLSAPTERPGLGRTAWCADPTGARLGLWAAGGLAGAEVVNAPGSWNWSNLSTTDPALARTFYEEVFGWAGRTVDFAPEATMWCRPGYGDDLAALDPELRRRHAEGGVPDGFSDAIGWMSAADDAVSAWTVTFNADDTDAVVDRAVAAGGSVVDPPTDLGPSRLAVLRDPQGATFTVSTYEPG